MNTTEQLTGDQYLTLAAPVSAELKVKGSRFIAHVFPVSNRKDAGLIYEKLRRKYHDATHNCFAWRLDADSFRYSDDGEPSGTAGKPILQAIDGYKLLEVICIITRYFGGVKLGTGRLTRAYFEAATTALQKSLPKIMTHTHRYHLNCKFESESTIRRLVNEMQGNLIQADYAEQLTLTVDIPRNQCELFENQLGEATAGQAVYQKLTKDI